MNKHTVLAQAPILKGSLQVKNIVCCGVTLVCRAEFLSKALTLPIQSMESVPQYSTHKKNPSEESYIKARLCGFLWLDVRSVCQYLMQARNHADVLT